MRIGLAYNLRREEGMAEAELLTSEDVKRLRRALESLGHSVVPIEVTGTAGQIVKRLTEARPDLIFNVAEGVGGVAREAYYPAVYRMLELPYTGSGAATLYVGLDKRLTEEILLTHGIRTPKGAVVTADRRSLPPDLPFPLIIKPNYEGSSKGIAQDSIVEDKSEAGKIIEKLLKEFPKGLTVEQYIPGREITVPWLEAWPGGLLEVVEWKISHPGEHDIVDYEIKEKGAKEGLISAVCPAELTPRQRQDILALSERAVRVLNLRDLGRIDIRLAGDGTPYLIEANPLPGLRPSFSLMTAGRAKGLKFAEVLDLIIRSAVRRYGLRVTGDRKKIPGRSRPGTARDLGITVGRFPSGEYNAITDVFGVKVGQVTRIEDVNGPDGVPTAVRTGVTAVVPSSTDYFNNHIVAGGFILNGVGEMSGLTQAMDWGWIETPILLTNTMSIGTVHQGIIEYMLRRHPELGRRLSVTIPLIGETDDSFLNDVRAGTNSVEDAIAAIEKAAGGTVEQGSVGGGTGMITFDFAGGIGSASRALPRRLGGYTVGALVQSNFGRMRNLTVAGRVVGKELDRRYPHHTRRKNDRGSVVVILATDAPMLSSQLNQLSKRAALGLGRVGSHAASGSGEILFAFSIANRTTRRAKEKTRVLNLSFVTDRYLDGLYEAAVEVTEEAVLNAMFCSGGMDGRRGRKAPALTLAELSEFLGDRAAAASSGGRSA